MLPGHWCEARCDRPSFQIWAMHFGVSRPQVVKTGDRSVPVTCETEKINHIIIIIIISPFFPLQTLANCWSGARKEGEARGTSPWWDYRTYMLSSSVLKSPCLQNEMSDKNWEPPEAKMSSSSSSYCVCLFLSHNIPPRASSRGTLSGNTSVNFQDHCAPPQS